MQYLIQILLGSLLVTPTAADDKAASAQQATSPSGGTETGTIKGQIVLPSKTPEGFRGGALSLKNAIVVIEGMYRGPRMNRPDNYREMSRDEREAWAEKYRRTDEYKEYDRKRREAYENRPVWKFPVDADGSFTVKGLKLARYNVIPVIPHPAATGKEMADQSWGSAFRQIVLSEERKSIDVGRMELKLKNVVMPGDVAPSWTATDYDGNTIRSSDFHGKYVVVDFWATWCIPCIAEIPRLEAVSRRFAGDNLQVIGLSLDDDQKLPGKFLQKRPTAYLQGYLGAFHGGESTTRDFGINSVPSIWLIGPDGRVIARGLSGEKIRAAVETAVKLSAAPE
ncbi:MAG: TlpA family protein disulfide reductase [Planctomycetaceae bacterium]|nr:TlpA family protein disulfide reductase [Planctomycetaceae bacterium]